MASDGNIYGGLGETGQPGVGPTIFQNGNENFFVFGQASGNAGPGPLTIGGDGQIYGVDADGVFYQLTTTGQLTPLVTLPEDTPSVTSLMQSSDGNFYITAATGTLSYQESGEIIRLVPPTPVPPPVQVSFPSATAAVGSPVELSWRVNNGFSGQLQVGYGTIPYGNPSGAGNWVGGHSGSVSDGAYRNYAKIIPTAPGNYTYALTCGGVESGSANLQVGYSTATSLSVSPTSVARPGTAVMTATVTSATGAVTGGSVTFQSEGVTIGSASVGAGGVAMLTASSASVPPGTYQVTATYSGSMEFLGSASAAVSVTVQ